MHGTTYIKFTAFENIPVFLQFTYYTKSEDTLDIRNIYKYLILILIKKQLI